LKYHELFKRRKPVRPKPDGLTRAEADAIEKEFTALFEPVAGKATQYFRSFDIKGHSRSWILPTVEDYRDVPIEKMARVLEYREFFLTEINKVQIDDVPF
jgi:hypothetical protein